ncbi:hypothetical protein J1N35_028216 [Gossypium stocksii]|uniref:Uncharacterized protein n=1 Tax=Gossypium stocksii TaxID=47602 RepID=A0A9D3UXA6_9ROSI|nr:hypothetical protein J1N35_028216 [Gossypium stocksii]
MTDNIGTFFPRFDFDFDNRNQIMSGLQILSFNDSKFIIVVFLFAVISSISSPVNGCFTSIFSFGDSVSDTGNLIEISILEIGKIPHSAFPPNGRTFFHRPTGRFCDGRLVIDFLAEALGLPFLPPYHRYKNGTLERFENGVNFAVGGAGALSSSFPGIYNPITIISLVDEVNSFKQFLNLRTDFKQLLRNSLIVMGEIGGNDYSHAFKQGKSIEDVRNFVPSVVDSITSSINELIELGAVTFLVPGNFPIGCSPSYLTLFQGSDKDQYDPLTGCLTWLNQFSQHHNQLLRKELEKIRNLHPDINIVYADYYSTTMRIYNSPNKFGRVWFSHFLRNKKTLSVIHLNQFFSRIVPGFKETLKACCGTGGFYNYNLSGACGYPPATQCCNDPSSYMSWDGIHFTEAVNRLIANVVFEELMNSIHSLNNLCPASTINKLRMIYPKSDM